MRANPIIGYRSLPKPRRARMAWNAFVKAHGSEPNEMWWNPPCWKGLHAGNANWGCWAADYGREAGTHHLTAHDVDALSAANPPRDPRDGEKDL